MNRVTETGEQEAVIEYCAWRRIPVVHIPNEGKRSAAYAAQMKRMGLAKGFPDLFIPVAVKEFAESVKMAFYYEFDELIPSTMADKIDEIVKEVLNEHEL